ncbi:hypothetical protein [Nocardiopsis sp. NPDC058789]|uniref:Uncharacterized protein n=1 Tax=Nocardiopsis eucommiae TaxID=2831970 RepID=A0A975LAZ1_9ACTN|nr:hypothetical protein KGD82_07945 [Nocardiopsis eucommiae]
MKLTWIASECGNRRTCPTVYATDRGTLVVQGYILADKDITGINIPDGESVVEIPLALLQEVARAHGS